MTEASRVQKLLNEQNAEIDRLKNRVKMLEAALAQIYAWYPISVSGPIKTIHEIRDHARKALDDAP